jgi:hypothetical protein
MNNKAKTDIITTKNGMKFKFPPEFLIDDFAYEMVEILFDIEILYLSNLSELSDCDLFKETPGQEYRSIADIPEDERELYKEDCKDLPYDDLEKIHVLYPKITKEKWAEIKEQRRQKYFRLIESKFKISMKDYPKEEKKLLVWKVANFIQYKLKMQDLRLYY